VSLFSKTPESFLVEWYGQNRGFYLEEYGGERAGVPKGEAIPFPPHKIDAAIALLAYGGPQYPTLTDVARSVSTSGALLRVWRTEARFLELYRRAVWKCADDYITLLGASWVNSRPAPFEEFGMYFGIALREAILRRLCVDVLKMDTEWKHYGLPPKAQAECTLVGRPPEVKLGFTKQQRSLVNLNTLHLLARYLVQGRIQDPLMAQWASEVLMDKWSRIHIVDTDIRDAVEQKHNGEAIGQIDFVVDRKPLDDVKRLYSLLHRRKDGRRA